MKLWRFQTIMFFSPEKNVLNDLNSPNDLKQCYLCLEFKYLIEFSKSDRYRDGVRNNCRACAVRKSTEWARLNPDRTKDRKKRWTENNRESVRKSSRERYARDAVKRRASAQQRRATPEGKETRRWEWIKRKYGLSKDQWNALFDSQGQRCGCCSTSEPGHKRGWHVDHNHTTGQVRGIVCGNCNTMLGCAKESPDNLLAGIAYLDRHRTC